eukprot:TRINITY_DN1181_c0_g1_i1.p1 TRINITY_DN1181_c0_g1~~TRINITY_DN1181_c0_g1_i1.p1  ORF type:complete len:672 (+),score=268.07 TRINITY_DN1181_c0_g1_i1:2739-4754(+)
MPNVDNSVPSYSELDDCVARLGLCISKGNGASPLLSRPDITQFLKELNEEELSFDIAKRTIGKTSLSLIPTSQPPSLDLGIASRLKEQSEGSIKVSEEEMKQERRKDVENTIFVESFPDGSSNGSIQKLSPASSNSDDYITNETGTIKILKVCSSSRFYGENSEYSNNLAKMNSVTFSSPSNRFRSISSPSSSPHRSARKKYDGNSAEHLDKSPTEMKRGASFRKCTSESSSIGSSSSRPQLLFNAGPFVESPLPLGRSRSNSASSAIKKKELKGSNSFEMPSIKEDGTSHLFSIVETREALKKSRPFLFPRDKKAEKLLSMRVMNLPIDESEDEYKIEECIVRLFDPVEGIKLKKHKGLDCFTGSKMVNWLKSTLYLDSQESVQFAQTSLMNRGVFTSISSKHQSFHDKPDVYYRFKFHDQGYPILNAVKFHLEEEREPVELSKNLLRKAMKLLDDCKSLDGRFYFTTVRSSKEYIRFCLQTTHLQTVNLSGMKPEERSAFYINVYNLLSIHARFALGEPKNTLERKEIQNRKYLIAMSEFTLEDIKSCMRNLPNSKGPAGLRQPILLLYLFSGTDRSLPIRVIDPFDFTKEKVKRILGDFLYKNSLASAKGELWLPKIFKEIGPDFGTTKKEIALAVGELIDSTYLSMYASQVELQYYEHSYERIRYLA